LSSTLSANRKVLAQPGAKGDASEINWLKMLEEHLPHRYQAHKAFIIDSNGDSSDQIDIVIYDRQYTPLLYNRDGQMFIPAESVYGVFEVKQELDKGNIEYAGKKAASVRKLTRTSTIIPHAGGNYGPKPLFSLIAGILTYENKWNPPFGKPLVKVLQEQPEIERLDLGCAVASGAFEVIYRRGENVEIRHNEGEITLIYFFFRLLERLQSLGTVSAIDYSVYTNKILMP
jgi:hypothetical protein